MHNNIFPNLRKMKALRLVGIICMEMRVIVIIAIAWVVIIPVMQIFFIVLETKYQYMRTFRHIFNLYQRSPKNMTRCISSFISHCIMLSNKLFILKITKNQIPTTNYNTKRKIVFDLVQCFARNIHTYYTFWISSKFRNFPRNFHRLRSLLQ
jgi:beta-xylosidase